MNLNAELNRSYLREYHKEIRKHLLPGEQVSQAGVYCCMPCRSGSPGWEFWGPRNFHTYVRANDAYAARIVGWQQWIRMFGKEK